MFFLVAFSEVSCLPLTLRPQSHLTLFFWFSWSKSIGFFFLIKSNKRVDTIGLFNKQVMLKLRNYNPLNKHVMFVSAHIVKYS